MKIVSNLILLFSRVKVGILRIMKDPLFLSCWDQSSIMNLKHRDQITARVIGGTFLKRKYDYKGNVFMFCEDMYNDVMPYRHIIGGGGENFSATLEPNNSNLEKMVAIGLRGESHRHQLADAVCDFGRDAAQSLFFSGCAVYEIVCERSQNGDITRFIFIHVNPFSVKKILGNYYQFIPWSVAKESRVKAGLIRIPKEKIIYITFPKELGGKHFIQKLRRLYRLSQELIPDFQMNAIKDNTAVNFSLDKYTHEKYIEQACLTRNFGWNQRKIPDNNILEYYSLYRRLKKRMAQTIVREKVIESINKALNGPLLNLGVKLVVDGMQTKSQIEEQFERLNAGNVEFIDIFNKTQF